MILKKHISTSGVRSKLTLAPSSWTKSISPPFLRPLVLFPRRFNRPNANPNPRQQHRVPLQHCTKCYVLLLIPFGFDLISTSLGVQLIAAPKPWYPWKIASSNPIPLLSTIVMIDEAYSSDLFPKSFLTLSPTSTICRAPNLIVFLSHLR